MRVMYSFIFIFVAASLFLLPVSRGIYDFKTDVREDTVTITTAAGVTSANFTLIKSVYDDDTSTISVTSNLSTDFPVFSSYNTTTRLLAFTGLTANASRLITAEYDIDALSDSPAIETFANLIPFLWIAFIVVLIGAGIAVLIWGRA